MLVGHSMDGILSRTQVNTIDRQAWNATGKPKADQFFAHVKPGSLVELAVRLISLPLDLTSTMTESLGASISVITTDSERLPNSVSGLSPNNPTFTVLDSRPIEVPHHSIIGDRGKGDLPDSSDGVVEYASSHLKSVKSEAIVPGPHGVCEFPETLDQLRHLLHLHLKRPTEP